MAIHFKIYPIIFSLPLYSALRGPSSTSTVDTIGSYIRSLFDFNQARIRLVLGKEQLTLFLLLNWWKILDSINSIYWPNNWFFYFRNLFDVHHFDQHMLSRLWMGVPWRVLFAPFNAPWYATQLFSLFLHALPHCGRRWYRNKLTDLRSSAITTSCYFKGKHD